MALLLIILIILSAFFSGSETAFFNIKEHQKTSSRVTKLLSKPRELLTFILVGNTLVNVAIGSIAANYTINVIAKQTTLFNKEQLLLMEVFLITLIILIFGEIIPKTFAIRQSVYFSNIISFPITFLLTVLKPFFFVFYKFSDLIIILNPFKKEQAFDSEEELKMVTEIVEQEGTIQETESNMIRSVFEFDDKLVKEILTPRVDIVAIDSKMELDQAMDLIKDKKFSKIPVYKDSIDNIEGILYAKDIIPYLTGARTGVNLLQLSREPFFIPETKPIDDLLEDFKIKKKNLAIAVDEWGGTSGLVTLEDVVEEVMGELSDPYDSEEYSFRKVKENNFIVEGSIKIYDLEENINAEFPDVREYDTLAGFILDKLGDIPKVGETVEYEKYSFKVIELNKNRIDKVEIREEK
ncbi:MAG: hypothetical protein CMG66_04890 [Candidatus Marinimicrobia bacterium]|nr:hypothetical protein [Candidatus Neomarinimicrobiota bacterium]|tara:strand:+ start:32483 stop:33709 length:1227 start_codon:yes stop_codon:yes gene_type:complete